MTLNEALDILRYLSDRHADGTSWTRDEGYVVVDFYAPDEDDADRLSEALIQLDEALSVVLAVYDTPPIRMVVWGEWGEETRPLIEAAMKRHRGRFW